MNYMELDTPALLIDKDILMNNCRNMQAYANRSGVFLRPHTKTHKMSWLAKLQVELGARGITVAKVGEAEVMAAQGLSDIFIANEIVGDTKLQRIRRLSETIDISFGLDSVEQAKMIERNFEGSPKKASVLIEIEVGEERSGIIEEADFRALLHYLKSCQWVHLKGLFSHDGHSYAAQDIEACGRINQVAQQRTLDFARIAWDMGFDMETVRVGSTPSMLHDFPVLEGITEIRPGTYVFMDASQANAYGSLERNAATVLTTVISRPTAERVITDVGAKGITAQTRSRGFTATKGLGLVKGWPEVTLAGAFDEHAIIYSQALRDGVKVGDKLEIIPNHICPVVNLHETAYLVEKGKVVTEIPVDCRGKLK